MTMRVRLIACAAVLAVAPGASPPEPENDLVVHEWGTFLSMSGSDGAALDGMYHEEHALPGFVHARSRDQLRIPRVRIKGETPVIYFYTRHPRQVDVSVRFPRGVWTQWFPQAQRVDPTLASVASAWEPRNGRIDWKVALVPPRTDGPAPALPATSAGALWNFARDVDACFVRTPDVANPKRPRETERFLFYRGLGQAVLPLKVEADTADGATLSLDGTGPNGVRDLFMIRVEGGRGHFTYRPEIAPGERVSDALPSMAEARPLAEFVPRLADALAARLVASGLYPKEARAMVNTWRTSYFQTEGIRVLFVLPQAWTNAFIPIAVNPPPKELVRVMVGRLEVLTPDREERAEAAVRGLASSDPSTRSAAFEVLCAEGRYVEPIVRRVMRTTRDDEVRRLCTRLLAADFVTELRAAIHGAGDGSRVSEDPVNVRAQLAALLHAVGRDDEAKAEAQRVVAALGSRPAAPFTSDKARHDLRARARAMEGLGDRAGEAQAYETFIRFGSQVADERGHCRGCHVDAGPRDMAFFRDWWAGAKYAHATARLGRLDSAIATHESAAADDSHDVAARMLLGYLYAEKGEARKAEAAWAQVVGPAKASLNDSRK